MSGKKTVSGKGGGETSAGLPFEIREVPLKDIAPDREFSFREGPLMVEGLRDSIRHGGGQKMEIAVRPAAKGKFQPIFGFRRLEALKKEGKNAVMAKVYTGISDEEALRLRFAENTGRQDYSPFEMVMICKKLKEKYKYSDGEIGRVIGRNRVSVNRYLAISRYPRILKRLERDEIGFKEAYQLATRAEELEKIKAAEKEAEKRLPRSQKDLQGKLQAVRKILKESFPGVSISLRSGGKKQEQTLNIFGIGLPDARSFFKSGEDMFRPLIGEE